MNEQQQRIAHDLLESIQATAKAMTLALACQPLDTQLLCVMGEEINNNAQRLFNLVQEANP
jgi:hypothetical protein